MGRASSRKRERRLGNSTVTDASVTDPSAESGAMPKPPDVSAETVLGGAVTSVPRPGGASRPRRRRGGPPRQKQTDDELAVGNPAAQEDPAAWLGAPW